MSPTTYADVLARNIRAARSRASLQQEPLATRMRALGYSSWQRQTVASVEKGRRRVSAEEILGLAVATETSIGALMAPAVDDKIVDLAPGKTLLVSSVRQSARGFNDGSVRWDGDIPVFVDTALGPVGALGGPALMEHIRKVEESKVRTRAQVDAGQFSEGDELR